MSSKRGDEEMKIGENIINSFQLFGNKYEKAVKHFIRASNLYKIAQEWENSGNALERVYKCNLKLKKDCGNALVEASKCFEKIYSKKAIMLLSKAIEHFMDDRNFSVLSRHQKKIGQLYENDGDLKNAILNFEKAIEYDTDYGNINNTTLLVKIARYSAQLENYVKAIEIYEKLAMKSSDNNLLKFATKEYFLGAGICHLCQNDVVSAEKALEIYKDLENFKFTPEFTLLEKIINACKKFDDGSFSRAVLEYDKIHKLDTLMTNLLLRIKHFMKI